MSDTAPTTILCNGASLEVGNDDDGEVYHLNYRPRTAANVAIGLPAFVTDVYHLPDRILDLLELASYVFAADRLVRRGHIKKAVEYQSWSRKIRIEIAVREPEFWSEEKVKTPLSEAIEFMTGDHRWQFTFQAGHDTPPTNLFDRSGFSPPERDNLAVQLFSGGADSLTGAVLNLEKESDRHICLVSHQANNQTIGIQNKLVSALSRHYGEDRVSHYGFETHLRDTTAPEESQRTRSFLYTSIAFAIAHAHSKDAIKVHENGVTSLNFPRRGDLGNARASRTTHPKAMDSLEELFETIATSEFHIEQPFFWKTKTDVLTELKNTPVSNLINSAVSCSKTFQHTGQTTHCGECFQCIDRRMAVISAGLSEQEGTAIYSQDLVREPVSSREAKTVVTDYLRQSRFFDRCSEGDFFHKYATELTDIVPYVGPRRDVETVGKVKRLCKRHGEQVRDALVKVRDRHDDPYGEIQDNTLLGIISDREHLKKPNVRLTSRIADILGRTVPKAYHSEPPSNERDLNETIHAILDGRRDDLRSEHPSVRFACAVVRPDHEIKKANVLIEGKYIRGATSPSQASEGIAADITKYPDSKRILFVVYDPEHAITGDHEFKSDFEDKADCRIEIIR